MFLVCLASYEKTRQESETDDKNTVMVCGAVWIRDMDQN